MNIPTITEASQSFERGELKVGDRFGYILRRDTFHEVREVSPRFAWAAETTGDGTDLAVLTFRVAGDGK